MQAGSQVLVYAAQCFHWFTDWFKPYIIKNPTGAKLGI